MRPGDRRTLVPTRSATEAIAPATAIPLTVPATILAIEPIRRLPLTVGALRTIERALIVAVRTAVMRTIGGRACRLMTITAWSTIVRAASAATAAAIAIPAIRTILPFVSVLAILLERPFLLKRALRSGVLTLRTIGAVKGAVVPVWRVRTIRQRSLHGRFVATGRGVAEAGTTFGRPAARLMACFAPVLRARFGAAFGARLAARRFGAR